MKINRRLFLKGTLASSTVAIAAAAGLIAPGQVLAAWPKDAFAAKDVTKATHSLFNGMDATASSDITVKVPDIAENGAVVPVTISSTIANVTSIAVVIEKNGTPLAANFKLSANALADISTRCKMGKTTNVIALVEAGGKLYKAHKEVKVTIGGCGG